MTLSEKLSRILSAENDGAMYEAVRTLTDNQKDIVIVSAFQTLRKLTPADRDVEKTINDLRRKIELELTEQDVIRIMKE